MLFIPNDVVALFGRLCIFGPVIYIGLWMIMNPGEFGKLLGRFAAQVADLQSFASRDFFRRPETPHEFRGTGALSRLSGAAFVLFGLAHLIGIVQ